MNPRIPLPPHLQGRVFTTAQGETAGLGRGRMSGKDLQRPYRAVRMPATAGRTIQNLCRAYQARMPPDAFFSGVTAAVIMGIPLPRRLEESLVLHVTVAYPRHPPSGRAVRGHSALVTEADARDWLGLRISSPERVFCELAALLDLPQLVAVGDFLIRERLPFTSLARLADTVDRFPGRRGLRILNTAVPLLNGRSESPRESRLRVIVTVAGLPGLVANLPISTSGGFHYRADLAFPRRRTIIEYQSDYHSGPEQFRADMTRRSRLEADGWFVVLVNADDLDDPAELVSRIRLVLAGRPVIA